MSHDFMKPIGVWYGWNSAWLNWCISENFCDTEYEFFYHINIKELNVLKITTPSEFMDFENNFQMPIIPNLPMMNKGINWTEVKKQFDGIEIIPYMHQFRFGHIWYYGWDVASGCVWNPKVKLHKLDDSHKFVKPYMQNKSSKLNA